MVKEFKNKGILHYYTDWLILNINDDITKYYRHLIWLYNRTINLQPCKHQSHITIIAGKYEKAIHKQYWNKHHNEEIEFTYSIDIQTDGCYFWLPVKCEMFENIREELGLTRNIPYQWHLTIGNLIK